MSPPASSASDKCQGRGKREKRVTNAPGASKGLSSHATCNCTKDQVGLSSWAPTGAQGKAQLTWHSAARGSYRQSLYSHEGMPLALHFQGVCAPGSLQTPPSTTALHKHGSTCSPQPEAGTELQPGQVQPPTLESWQAEPCNPSRHSHLLPPVSTLSFPDRGHWQDPALLLLGSWQSDRSLSCCGLDPLHT